MIIAMGGVLLSCGSRDVCGLQCTLTGRPGLPAAPLAARADNLEASRAREPRFPPLFPWKPPRWRAKVTALHVPTASPTTLRACRFARAGHRSAQVQGHVTRHVCGLLRHRVASSCKPVVSAWIVVVVVVGLGCSLLPVAVGGGSGCRFGM